MADLPLFLRRSVPNFILFCDPSGSLLESCCTKFFPPHYIRSLTLSFTLQLVFPRFFSVTFSSDMPFNLLHSEFFRHLLPEVLFCPPFSQLAIHCREDRGLSALRSVRVIFRVVCMTSGSFSFFLDLKHCVRSFLIRETLFTLGILPV